MHSLSGRSSAMGCNHGSVGHFIKLDTEITEPFDRFWSFADKLAEKFRLSCKMTSAKCVKIMLRGRVIFLIGGLNSAFRHHSISISDAQLGNNHNFCACVICFNCGGSSCSSSSDYKHINVINRILQIRFIILKAAVRLKKLGELLRNLFALVRSDFEFGKFAFLIVRMIF